MRDFLFGDSFGANPRLNTNSKQMGRYRLFDLLANSLAVVKSFLLVKQESKSIDRISHYMDNYFDDV
jgi:hypothetical protein